MLNPFSILVGVGAALGVVQVSRHAAPRDVSHWSSAALWVLLGCLVGARLGYVFFAWGYFSRHLPEAFMIWKGGLSWPGAVAGGLLVCILLSVLWHASLTVILDHIAPLLPPLSIAIWLGCWQTGVAYGAAVPAGAWWGVPAMDETGAISPRLPVQLLAALFLLLFFGWQELRRPRISRRGSTAALILLGLSACQLGSSFLRVDPAPSWAGLRPDTWGGVVFLALACIFAAWTFLPHAWSGRPLFHDTGTIMQRRKTRD